MKSTSASLPVTKYLRLIQAGDSVARDQLFELLIRELRGQANYLMRSEKADHSLGASGLVNETCLRLLEQHAIFSAANRRQLFGAANRAMRQILVDHARRRGAVKRGGDREKMFLDNVLDSFVADNGFVFEQLHEALDKLELESPRQREVVEHRFFGGLSIAETASLIGVSTSTIEREWRLARVKLYAWINPR